MRPDAAPCALRRSGRDIAIVLVAFSLALAAHPALPRTGPTGEPSPIATRIDLNEADVATLAALPGIGPTVAARIVDDRTAHGRFEGAGDLVRVHGIGPRTVERIERLVVAR